MLYFCLMALRIKYYLTRPEQETSPIRMSVSYKGRDFIYLEESILTAHWDAKNHRAIVKPGRDNSERVNSRLKKYETWAEAIYNTLKDSEEPFNYMDIIERLEPKILGLDIIKKKKPGFFDFVDSFISQQDAIKDRKGNKRSYVKALEGTKKLLKGFEKKQGPVTFTNMDMDFYSKFVTYMTEEECAINTAGGHIKRLRRFLRESKKQKLHDLDHYESFRGMEVDVDTIALTWDEVDRFAKAKPLSPELEKQRDVFVVACYTGLRHSDFERLKPQNFVDGYIHIKMEKSKRPVTIPIHKKAIPILDKYGYELPEMPSQQKFNENLKTIGQKAEINETVYWSEYKLGGYIDHESPKYELISTHTARRSFATNMYRDGVQASILMKITGHKTEKDFFKYIRLNPMDEARMMKKIMDAKK